MSGRISRIEQIERDLADARDALQRVQADLRDAMGTIRALVTLIVRREEAAAAKAGPHPYLAGLDRLVEMGEVRLVCPGCGERWEGAPVERVGDRLWHPDCLTRFRQQQWEPEAKP